MERERAIDGNQEGDPPHSNSVLHVPSTLLMSYTTEPTLRFYLVARGGLPIWGFFLRVLPGTHGFVGEEFLAEAEIRQNDVTLRVQEDIFQFDVPIDNPELKQNIKLRLGESDY